MANPTGSFVWYELLTPDPDGAKAFYDQVVGWNIAAEAQFPNGYRMIGRSDGKSAGGVMPINDEMRDHGAKPTWLGYLSVADADLVADAILADGGQVHLPPFDIPGVGRMAMVTDPWGAPFYIMRPIPPADDPEAISDVFDPMKAGHVRWNELSTGDPAGAVAFYGKHFGWAQEGCMEMGDLGQYQFIQHDNAGIGAIMPLMPGMPQAAWSYYIGVDDIDRAARAIADGGGSIMQEPMEIPGGEYALNATDPQDASFGLVGPRKQ
jgi:predicted enzyme related to lactoylglutathione lyase